MSLYNYIAFVLYLYLIESKKYMRKIITLRCSAGKLSSIHRLYQGHFLVFESTVEWSCNTCFLNKQKMMRLTWNPKIFSELRLVYNKNTYYRDGSLMLLRVRDKRGHAHMYRYHVDLFFPTAVTKMRKTKLL